MNTTSKSSTSSAATAETKQGKPPTSEQPVWMDTFERRQQAKVALAKTIGAIQSGAIEDDLETKATKQTDDYGTCVTKVSAAGVIIGGIGGALLTKSKAGAIAGVGAGWAIGHAVGALTCDDPPKKDPEPCNADDPSDDTTNPDTETNTDADTDNDTETNTDADTDTDTDTDTGSDADMGTGADTDVNTDAIIEDEKPHLDELGMPAHAEGEDDEPKPGEDGNPRPVEDEFGTAKGSDPSKDLHLGEDGNPRPHLDELGRPTAAQQPQETEGNPETVAGEETGPKPKGGKTVKELG